MGQSKSNSSRRDVLRDDRASDRAGTTAVGVMYLKTTEQSDRARATAAGVKYWKTTQQERGQKKEESTVTPDTW